MEDQLIKDLKEDVYVAKKHRIFVTVTLLLLFAMVGYMILSNTKTK